MKKEFHCAEIKDFWSNAFQCLKNFFCFTTLFVKSIHEYNFIKSILHALSPNPCILQPYPRWAEQIQQGHKPIPQLSQL